MLNRQRVVLALLERARRPLLATTFVKLAFLVRQETPLRADRTFYGFVPYRYGPFSFQLYRDLSLLERDGYVERGSERVELKGHLRGSSLEEVQRLSDTHKGAVEQIVRTYGRLARVPLIRAVYDGYPWYATKTELVDLRPARLPRAPACEIAVHTLGYQGDSVDDFFDRVLRIGLAAILDVRANPVSRKYGFAKRSLGEIATRLGLQYHHIPELGIASEHRATLGDYDSYQRLLDSYESTMLPAHEAALRRASSLLRKEPSALLCAEREVRWCHRGRLANRIAAETGLPILHH